MANVLTSWKEIADYLGKAVRTVQRWERELGLPVRRPDDPPKHVVLALRDELDAWLRRQPRRVLEGDGEIEANLQESIVALIQESAALREELERALAGRGAAMDGGPEAELVQRCVTTLSRSSDLVSSCAEMENGKLAVVPIRQEQREGLQDEAPRRKAS